MTTAGSSIAFGDANSGLQVGQSFAPISAEFHLAPGQHGELHLLHSSEG